MMIRQNDSINKYVNTSNINSSKSGVNFSFGYPSSFSNIFKNSSESNNSGTNNSAESIRNKKN
jgi:hypothetical protein